MSLYVLSVYEWYVGSSAFCLVPLEVNTVRGFCQLSAMNHGETLIGYVYCGLSMRLLKFYQFFMVFFGVFDVDLWVLVIFGCFKWTIMA